MILDVSYSEMTHIEASTTVCLNNFKEVQATGGYGDFSDEIAELEILVAKISSALDEMDQAAQVDE